MSHPVGISCRWQRTISRMRRRMRLRTTAPPNVFLMLNPNRLIGCPLARTNTVKWELERRLPARYTLSNSLFRTNRNSRGNVWPAAGPWLLLGCEAMTTLLAARRKHFAATFGLHAHAKPVRLSAAAFPRLICTLWQAIPLYRAFVSDFVSESFPNPTPEISNRLAARRCQFSSSFGLAPGSSPSSHTTQSGQSSEFTSVLAVRAQGQENAVYGYRAGKGEIPRRSAWLPVIAREPLQNTRALGLVLQDGVGSDPLGRRIWRSRSAKRESERMLSNVGQTPRKIIRLTRS